MEPDTRFRRAFLVLIVAVITAAFFTMLRAFLLTIVLAALISGVAYPAYRQALRVFRGRQTPAGVVTLLLLLVVVIVPLLLVAGAVANEALRLNDTLLPRLERLVDEPGEFEQRLGHLPGYHLVAPYRAHLLTKAAEVLGSAGRFVFDAVSATTLATAVVVFQFVVMLYTMFSFSTRGRRCCVRS